MNEPGRLRRGAMIACGLAAVLAALATAFPAEYRQKDTIAANITSPAAGTYVLINHTQTVRISAYDADEIWNSCLGEWKPYSDNVTSGTTVTDYHVRWTATAGKFDTVWGLLDEAYTTSVDWVAPDDLGDPVEQVTLVAYVDDFNRDGDTGGYDDDAVIKTLTLNAWRLDVTAKTSGVTTRDLYNDCRGWYEIAYPDTVYPFGLGNNVDNVLGFVTPGSPSGNEYFAGKIELKAIIPAPQETAETLNYFWYQQALGYTRQRNAGSGTWEYSHDWSGYWHSDNPPTWNSRPQSYRDADPRSPSEPQWGDTPWNPLNPPDPMPSQTYRGELYLLDSPGVWNRGYSTTTYDRIEMDDGTNGYCRFRAFVLVDDLTASNVYEWHVGFVLVPVGGVWTLVGAPVFP